MCKILNRIKEIVEHENITIAALERSIGASKGVIYKAVSKGTDIQSKWLEAIVENYPQYSAQWLLTGEGEMLKSESWSPDKPKTSPDRHDHDAAVAPHISREHTLDPYKPFERLINPPSAPEGIPLVSVQAVGGFAGKDFSIRERDIEAYYVIPKFRNLNVDFLIEVVGDSMMPRIFPGDIIACSIIRNPRFIQWNKTYLVSSDEQGMIVKRLKKSHDNDCLLAVSDNTEYDPFDIPLSDIKGLARVVGVIHAE